MLIFDIGFFDGKDSEFYLALGAQVIAFEANPLLYEAGKERFSKNIASGRLELVHAGIGIESGEKIDFFINLDNAEWSTFYREAALNWGPGKYEVIKVPCITPGEAFQRYGCPHYLKSDIEGFDIHVATALIQESNKPEWVSFEASSQLLLRTLLLAGYKSFKLIDQAEVPKQKAFIDGKQYIFQGGTGKFGDDTPGEWLSFENIQYLYFRFGHDPFNISMPQGHWFDIHAGRREPAEINLQLRWMRDYINDTHSGHCGFIGQANKPECPFTLLNNNKT